MAKLHKFPEQQFFKPALDWFSKHQDHPLADQFAMTADLSELQERRIKDKGRTHQEKKVLRKLSAQYKEMSVETYFEALTMPNKWSN